MKVLIVLAVILLALFLLGQVRLGALVEYGPPGLHVRAKVGPLSFTVYPPKPKKRKKEPAPAAESAPKKSGGSLAQVRRFLPLVGEAAGRLRRKIRIDQFLLDFTAAASDPAAAALSFGGANAAVGMIWPLVEQNFNVKERQIRTRVDFTAQRPVVDLRVRATLTVGQALILGLGLARKAMPLLSEGREETQKEAV